MSLLTSRLYLRSGELTVGPKADNNQLVDSRVFKTRLKFNIVKSTKPEPNTSSIGIYNLSETSRVWLEKEDLGCFLNVGYGGDITNVFVGDIQRVIEQRQGPDIITTLECGDGERKILESVIQIGRNPGVTNTQILNQSLSELGLSIGIQKGLTEIVYQNGFTYSGTIRSLLDQLTEQMGVIWSSQDEEILILKEAQTDDQIAVEIGPDTGLVGYPTKTEKGFEFMSLLNPFVKPNRAVRLISKRIQGAFDNDSKKAGSRTLAANGKNLKATRVEHIGDTQEGEWVTKIEAVDPEAA